MGTPPLESDNNHFFNFFEAFPNIKIFQTCHHQNIIQWRPCLQCHFLDNQCRQVNLEIFQTYPYQNIIYVSIATFWMIETS